MKDSEKTSSGNRASRDWYEEAKIICGGLSFEEVDRMRTNELCATREQELEHLVQTSRATLQKLVMEVIDARADLAAQEDMIWGLIDEIDSFYNQGEK